jgi:G:T/U-mismatch repair DNA glycosylase
VGIGAKGGGWGARKVRVGRQERTIGGSGVWVLPNTSGLNANYQIAELGRLFGELRVLEISEEGKRQSAKGKREGTRRPSS